MAAFNIPFSRTNFSCPTITLIKKQTAHSTAVFSAAIAGFVLWILLYIWYYRWCCTYLHYLKRYMTSTERSECWSADSPFAQMQIAGGKNQLCAEQKQTKGGLNKQTKSATRIVIPVLSNEFETPVKSPNGSSNGWRGHKVASWQSSGSIGSAVGSPPTRCQTNGCLGKLFGALFLLEDAGPRRPPLNNLGFLTRLCLGPSQVCVDGWVGGCGFMWTLCLGLSTG